MKLLDKASASAAVKLAIFLVVTTVATAMLAVTIGNLSFGAKDEYRAMFNDVTGVAKGDDVRVAGVRVGSVKKVEVKSGDKAVLTFDVDSSTPLTQNTNVAIRFRNLVGQRYLALAQGSDGGTKKLGDDDVIPLSRTTEALDLNVLFNGFKPLFQALSPSDTNKLAFELIQVLQGEGGNVKELLTRTASVTKKLASRDDLIGDVIVNLNDVLETVASRDKELSRTIITLQQFATGLKDDRKAILGSLDSVSDLAVTTAGLVDEAREPLTEDITQLNELTSGLNTSKNKRTLDTELQILPIKFSKLGTKASTGSFFNFYLCHLKGVVQFTDPNGDPLPGLPEIPDSPIGGPSGLQAGGERCPAPETQKEMP